MVTSERLSELCIAAHTSELSLISILAAYTDSDLVLLDVSEQSNSPTHATRQTELNVKAVKDEPRNVSESGAAGTDAAVEANADDGTTVEVVYRDEGANKVAPMTVDEEAVQKIAPSRGKEYPALSVSDVEVDDFHFLGLLPWFDIRAL